MVGDEQLKVDYRIERPVAPGGSGDEAIIITGTILSSGEEGGGPQAPSPIGIIQAVVFHGNSPEDMAGQFDPDVEWLPVYEDYLEKLEENKYVVEFEYEAGSVEVSKNPNCILITFVGLVPSFRGKGIAKKIIRNILETFGVRKCGAAFVFPFPLHFNHEKFLRKDFCQVAELFKANADVSFTPLLEYYKSMGFRQLKDSRLFFLNIGSEGWDRDL